MKKHIALLFTILILSTSQSMFAQNSSTTINKADRWYVGGGAAFSFGNSTLQSIGADKTRLGWGLGVLGGYRINSFLSTEASFDYTRLGLESYYCCQTLWLDNNGNRYTQHSANGGTYSYRDIYSSVNLFQIGLHLNVDFLKMFRPSSRWSVMLSPAIYAVGTNARVKEKGTKSLIYSSVGSAHFGVGGDLGVGYQVNKDINVRLYSGINYLTGAPIDGIPRVEHKSNYVWNTGVKVTFALNKFINCNKAKAPKRAAPIQPYKEPVAPAQPTKVEEVAPTPIVEVAAPIEEVKVVVTEEVKAPAISEKIIYQTSVYFDTNSANVKKKFYLNIAKLINKAKENSNAKVIIDGWADKTGNDNINGKISDLRAKTLRNYFISQGIKADRIEYRGHGVDNSKAANDKARRTDILLTIAE